MLRTLEREWNKLRAGKPGTRFQNVHQTHVSSAASRWFGTLLGAVLLLGGIAALPLPGPGTLVIALGVAIIARESPRVARLADQVELQLRQLWQWGHRQLNRL